MIFPRPSVNFCGSTTSTKKPGGDVGRNSQLPRLQDDVLRPPVRGHLALRVVGMKRIRRPSLLLIFSSVAISKMRMSPYFAFTLNRAVRR
jgi:hypothetical protein